MSCLVSSLNIQLHSKIYTNGTARDWFEMLHKGTVHFVGVGCGGCGGGSRSHGFQMQSMWSGHLLEGKRFSHVEFTAGSGFSQTFTLTTRKLFVTSKWLQCASFISTLQMMEDFWQKNFAKMWPHFYALF